MALIQNISRETLTLSTGAPLISGDEANADLGQALEQSYLDAGLIAVIDPDAPLNIPAASTIPFTGFTGSWDTNLIYSPGQIAFYEGIAYVCVLQNVGHAPDSSPSQWSAVFSGALGVGLANGVATLDGTGKLTVSQVPSIAISDVHVVASDAAMRAIAGAHSGTVAVRTDQNNQAYMNNGGGTGTDSDWVEIGFVDVVSVNGKQGVVVLASTDLSDSVDLARLASPAFTGSPTAPTQTQGDDSTKLSTTAYVDAAKAAAVAASLQKASNLSDVASAATALANLGGAPLASPALTGAPTAPTPTAGDSSTKVATTAFVGAAIAAQPAAPVTQVFGRTGAVAAQSGDYTAAQVTNAADKSSASAQSFTGVVSAPAVAATLAGSGRFVGVMASGPPSSGTYLKDDFVVDETGAVFVCTAGGSPGTWASKSSTVTAHVAADVTTVTASTPVSTGMTFPIANGETWSVEFNLVVAPSTSGGSCKLGVYGPTGTLLATLTGATNATTAVASDVVSAPSTPNSVAFATGTAAVPIRISALYTATAAGTVSCQFQQSGSSITMTVKAGSYMTARRSS